MKKSQELRKARKAVKDEIDRLLNEAYSASESGEEEKRSAAMAKYNEQKAKYDSLTQLIEAAEEQEQRAAAEAADQGSRHDPDENEEEQGEGGDSKNKRRGAPDKKDSRSPEQRAFDDFSLLDVLRAAAHGKPFEGRSAEMIQEGAKQLRQNGIDPKGNITLPQMVVKRAQTVGTATEGGNTVPTNMGPLVPILDPRIFLQEMGAMVMEGLSGNVEFPRNNGDVSATWEGETAAATETTATFDKLSMSPLRLAARQRISYQLLNQSSFSVENFARQRLNIAVSKKLNQAALTGTGTSNQPLGLLNNNNVTVVAMGTNGGNLTWAKIVELETKVAENDADFGSLAYLTTPGVRGFLKTTEKVGTTGQFMWQDDRVGSLVMGALNSAPGYVSSLVPKNLTKGTSSGVCHALIYGNFSEIVIGNWGGIDLLVNPYLEHHSGVLNISVNSYWNWVLLHDKAIALIKDITVP